MKRIILILTIISIGFESYSQLDLDYYKIGKDNNGSKNYNETIEGLIEPIFKDNPSLDTYKIFDGYTFDDGYQIKFAIFTDNNGKFIDLIFFSRDYGRFVEGEYTRWGIRLNSNLQYSLDRKINNFNSNFDDKHKFIFDDKSYIVLEFNTIKHDKTYRYFIEDHITEDNYKFGGHNYK